MQFRIRSSQRAQLRGRRIIAAAILLLASGSVPAATSKAAAERFVAIAWSDTLSGRASIQRFQTQSPWAFNGESIIVGGKTTLRFAGEHLYAVSEIDGTVTAIDGASWSVAEVYALGAQSQPLDIAIASPDTAYLTMRDSTQLLRLNLDTGATQNALDVAGFTNPGGLLTAGMMAVDAGRLFIQVSRVEAASANVADAVDPTGYLAVVDIASEQLVDVDPIQEGVQAIALQGTFPKYKMNLLRDQRRLYLSASGAFFDEGGLDEVDLDALTSLGLVIAEADGNTAADLGSFAMVAADRGFLVSSTDFAPSSHLARFSLTRGVEIEELFVTVDYRVPTMVHDPPTRTLFVPDGGLANAYWIFDVDTGEQLNGGPLLLGGPATDIALLCDPQQSCDCAIGYSCEAVPTFSNRGFAMLCVSLMLIGLLFAFLLEGPSRSN
jgi:hypothetical protein